jgi:hypothetical protein
MKKLSTKLMILLLCLATGIHAAPVTHDSQSVLRIKGGEESHHVQTSMLHIIRGTAMLAKEADYLAKRGFWVGTRGKLAAKTGVEGVEVGIKAASPTKAARVAVAAKAAKVARAARLAKLAKGGAIAAAVVVVVAAVVGTVLITKKVKKDNRQRRGKLKKLKKYQKLRARAEIEYAHRHRSSKWRYRVR